MPTYTYSGVDRYYPTLSLAVSDGDTATRDDIPTDGRWSVDGVPVETASDLTPDQPPRQTTKAAKAATTSKE